jgi:hypothetical protein
MSRLMRRRGVTKRTGAAPPVITASVMPGRLGQFRFKGQPIPESSAGTLRWSPPVQSNPTLINVPTTGLSRTLGTSEDAILQFPSSTVTGQVGITGGRHIRAIGGRMLETRTTTSQKYQILVRECRGSVFLEGLDLDASTSQDTDNVVVSGYAPRGVSKVGWSYPDLYVQNCRFLGAQWSGGDVHPDLIQKQSAMGSLRIHKFTGEMEYQGLEFAPQSFTTNAPQEAWLEGLQTGMWLDEVDIRAVNEVKDGYLIWFGWMAGQNGGFAGPEDPRPHYLNDVYVQGTTTLNNLGTHLAFPRVGTTGNDGEAIGMILAGDGLSATWPAVAQIYGTIRKGVAPVSGGQYVPAGAVGIGYSSPGYQ